MILTIYILIAIAVLCTLIAKEKNRNPWLGFLSGLFFGIFALIYYLAVGKKEKKENVEAKK